MKIAPIMNGIESIQTSIPEVGFEPTDTGSKGSILRFKASPVNTVLLRSQQSGSYSRGWDFNDQTDSKDNSVV